MRVYLAGPMSGIPDDNFPAFNEAARVLRADGYEVVNPTEFGEEPDGVGTPDAALRASYLKLDIHHMMECDAIALLPGWFASIGANVELTVALAAGLGVYMYDPLGWLDRVAWAQPNWEIVRRHVDEMARRGMQ